MRSGGNDFLALYRELDLVRDCALNEFKRAYRRRVAELHPDRESRNECAQEPTERLQHLTAMYAEAMEFHRRHGRLPGQAAQVSARAPAAGLGGHRPRSSAPATEPVSRRPRWLLIAALIVLVAWLLWEWDAQSPLMQDMPFNPSGRHTTGDRSGPSPPATGGIALGMEAKTVRGVLGKPATVGADRWDYGPSWVRFEDGKVVDWYSSPLYPLKVAQDTPSREPSG